MPPEPNAAEEVPQIECCITCDSPEPYCNSPCETWLKEHDTAVAAAAVAAAREQWEKERKLLEDHWRDLWLSDIISSIEWEARHGNPELFKAVQSLKTHKSKFSVEDYEARIRADATKQERERVLQPFVEFAASLRDIESSFVKYKLNEIAEQLREG